MTLVSETNTAKNSTSKGKVIVVDYYEMIKELLQKDSDMLTLFEDLLTHTLFFLLLIRQFFSHNYVNICFRLGLMI